MVNENRLPPPTSAFDIELTEHDVGAGYCFGRPPGLASRQWPRSRVNGIPMAHVFTVVVPEPYRVRGPEFVAIALFQADDHVADPVDGVAPIFAGQSSIAGDDGGAGSPHADFLRAVRDYANDVHPHELYITDAIGGGWALLWLTQQEFTTPAGPLPEPATIMPPDYASIDFAVATDRPPKFVGLNVRVDDPNVGQPLVQRGFTDHPESLMHFFGKSHFGGTAFPEQGTIACSPFYIEFEERLGGSNMGGGNGQVDLLTGELHWACG